MAKNKEDNVETYEGPVSEAPIKAAEEQASPAEAREPQAVVNQGEVPAQVAGEAPKAPDTVRVNETHVTLDEVITDPSSPLAVQVPEPDAGAGVLPAHALAGKRPEDVFASEASKPDSK